MLSASSHKIYWEISRRSETQRAVRSYERLNMLPAPLCQPTCPSDKPPFAGRGGGCHWNLLWRVGHFQEPPEPGKPETLSGMSQSSPEEAWHCSSTHKPCWERLKQPRGVKPWKQLNAHNSLCLGRRKIPTAVVDLLSNTFRRIWHTV